MAQASPFASAPPEARELPAPQRGRPRLSATVSAGCPGGGSVVTTVERNESSAEIG